MPELSPSAVHAAEVVLPCAELDASLRFYTETLGFRVRSIFPADDPSVAVLSGSGLTIRLVRDLDAAPGTLRVLVDNAALAGLDSQILEAPNGTRIELTAVDPPVQLPPLVSTLSVSTPGAEDQGAWVVGRAGMRYRDLLPGRLGGRFIASHIHIPDGGPVPDYVHFHKIRFQMIYCYKGWVRVVYEDQGPAFVMHAGDCVLQPPRIRHRVLESSPDLEVVEIGCPAEHETHADPAVSLPNSTVDPARDFDGQRFVRHVAAQAPWAPWRAAGFEARDIGMAQATAGLADVHVVRPRDASQTTPNARHDGEFLLYFVLTGAATLRCAGHADAALAPGSAVSVPPGLTHALVSCSADLELLEVTLPAALPVA